MELGTALEVLGPIRSWITREGPEAGTLWLDGRKGATKKEVIRAAEDCLDMIWLRDNR